MPPYDSSPGRAQVAGPSTRSERVAAIVALGRLDGASFTRGRVTVLVDGEPQMLDLNGKLGVRLWARVSMDGVDVTPSDLNPITIVNPPMAVMGLGGIPVVDPWAAFRAVLLDIVKGL